MCKPATRKVTLKTSWLLPKTTPSKNSPSSLYMSLNLTRKGQGRRFAKGPMIQKQRPKASLALHSKAVSHSRNCKHTPGHQGWELKGILLPANLAGKTEQLSQCSYMSPDFRDF